MSSLLFCVHERLSHGATFSTPDYTTEVHYSTVGFVNDSTSRVNDFYARPQPDDTQLLNKMQHDAQVWSNLLWTGGGMLELPKCSFHYVLTMYNPDGIAHLIDKPNIPDLHLQDPTHSQSICINRKSIFENHKTLGHYKSPSGNLKLQRKKRIDTAKTMALSITSSRLTLPLAYQMYLAVYLPTIQYTLPQGHHDKKSLDKDQSKSMRLLFSKCGFNQNTSKAIMYTPRKLGGAGFVDWSTLQGEGQLTHFLRLWRSDTKLGSTLKISLAWAQLQSGMSFSILEHPLTPIPPVDTKWIKSLRNFLVHINGAIRVHRTFVYPSQRTNDVHLMDVAMS